MRFPERYRVVSINFLISVAISLIVNFSYFIFYLGSNTSVTGHRPPRVPMEDSSVFLILQVLYFIVLSFILLSLTTANLRKKSSSKFVVQLLYCVLVCVAFYFITPNLTRSGEIDIQMNARRIFSPMLTLKSCFTLIVAVLYGKIFELVYQKQHIVIENQLLKNENLQTRYNMLINQINPHFFFNSLNSLSMLVRAGQNDGALTYIDRLSDTFRYIIQNGSQGLTTLGEELKFLDAYKYLHEVRYADKLFFDIEIDENLKRWQLPSMSLQPLIENAVKHNSITRSRPFHVSIRTQREFLIVSNPIIPKIDAPGSTGIGLKNLSSRYVLLTGREIVVKRSAEEFSVELPLIPPQPCV